jgi:hypothetical protein
MIHTDSLDWYYYQVEKELYLDAMDTIRIQIEVGGLKYDDMQIDGLEVVAWPLLAAETNAAAPAAFTLEPAYPNPFNPTTTICYALPASRYVTLRVYDLMGREVASLVQGYQPAGEYELLFDARKLPSGNYFTRLATGQYSQTIKMLLLK